MTATGLGEWIADSNGVEAAFARLKHSLLNIGFDHISYVNFGQVLVSGWDSIKGTIAYPTAWLDHYTKEQMVAADILFQLAKCNRQALTWDRIRQSVKLTKAQQRIFDEGNDAGLKHGVTIPFHGPQGPTGTFTISTSGTQNDTAGLSPEIVGLCAQFHYFYEASMDDHGEIIEMPRLGKREIECLKWMALGKSSTDIAAIMTLTPLTVDTYAKRIMEKLNVTSRISAVLAAARLGLIKF